MDTSLDTAATRTNLKEVLLDQCNVVVVVVVVLTLTLRRRSPWSQYYGVLAPRLRLLVRRKTKLVKT